MPRLRSVVATGRRMKGSEGITSAVPWPPRPSWRVLRTAQAGRAHRARTFGSRGARARDASIETIEIEVDHRRREERQQLRQDQAADDRDAERPAQFGARA